MGQHVEKMLPSRRRLIEELSRALGEIAQVEAVALGGSSMTGQADAASDIDLYVYSTEPVPIGPRLKLAEQRATIYEVGNDFMESGDEWDDRETGIHVDIIYRDFAGSHAALSRVLERCEASFGYTTCIWHNIGISEPLFDRVGKFAALQKDAKRPYPRELVSAIIKRNRPMLRDSFVSFGGQILKAAQRSDLVSINHRTAAFLASYFDILFAANSEPHPGEKRLLRFAAALPKTPVAMGEDVEAILIARDPADLYQLIDSLTDKLDTLLRQLGLSPAPHGVGR